MLIINVKLHPRHTLIKTCPICKKLFPQKGKGNKKYCNPKCAEKTIKNRKRIEPKIRICPNCKIQFKVLYKGNIKYCSPKCASITKKQQTKESDQKRIKNRDKIEHAAKMRKLYHTNLLKKNKKPLGTIIIPPTPVQETTAGEGGGINLRLGYISSNINKRKKKIRFKNQNRLPKGELTS